MNSINEIFEIDVKIDNKKLIIEFVATGNSITELLYLTVAGTRVLESLISEAPQAKAFCVLQRA